MNLSKLNCKLNTDIKKMRFPYSSPVDVPDEEFRGVIVDVRQYLPIQEKIDLIDFVIGHAIDSKTGCFSPVRTEVYYKLALAKWYAGIKFTDKQIENAGKTYDILESNDFFGQLMRFGINMNDGAELSNLLNATINDISRYNNSFVGVLNMMTDESRGLNENLQEILTQIKNKEGIETLSVIKDMVGTD